MLRERRTRNSVAKRNLPELAALALLFTMMLVSLEVPSAPAKTLTVLHAFAGTDGACPESVLTMDAKGNLYSAAPEGFSDGASAPTSFARTPDGAIYATTLMGGGTGCSGVGCAAHALHKSGCFLATVASPAGPVPGRRVPHRA